MDVIHLRQDFDEIRLQSVVSTLCFSQVQQLHTLNFPRMQHHNKVSMLKNEWVTIPSQDGNSTDNDYSLAIPLPPLMPIAPEIFFGTDELVSHLLYETNRRGLLC
jgi:hypothetical protein